MFFPTPPWFCYCVRSGVLSKNGADTGDGRYSVGSALFSPSSLSLFQGPNALFFFSGWRICCGLFCPESPISSRQRSPPRRLFFFIVVFSSPSPLRCVCWIRALEAIG